MAYKVIILYRLYMPSYFLGTFTEYPCFGVRANLYFSDKDETGPENSVTYNLSTSLVNVDGQRRCDF